MPAARPDTPYPDLPLTLLTLGGASLVSPSSSGPERPLLGPGKPLALVVYLACAPRRTATRDHLVDLLWADVHPERGRHALRQTIWHIKRTVGTPLLNTVDGRIELARSIPCDRDVLLAAVEVGDPESVVRAYRGEFLPSFAIPGGSEFERWADVERLRLRAHFLQAADDLTRRHLAAARFKEAVALARRARDEAPLDERPWRLLFEALAASGDQLRFTAEVEAFRRQLAEDEREPDQATVVRMQWPEQETATVGNTTELAGALTPELVGRQREFNAILRAWEGARNGPARHLHLSAAAGLGKTRLLHDAQRRLRAGGARTVYLRSSPSSRFLAHSYAGDLAHALAALPGAKGVPDATAGVLVALDPSLSAIYRATPDLTQGDESLRRRILALTDLVTSIAEEAPLALFLDDLHWADDTSRQLLLGLLERLDGAHVLVVTAARPAPESVQLRQRATPLDLAPLIVPQLGELVASLGHLPTDPWGEGFPTRLWEASGGSPLLAIEALQLALDESVLRLDAEGWHCEIPQLLAAAFPAGGSLRRRVESLPRTEGWLLLLLALEGEPIAAQELITLSGHPAEQAAAAALTLEQKGFVHRLGDRLEPAHDEFARLAIELAEPGARQAGHKLLASRTARSDVRVVARHLRAAGDADQVRALFFRWVGSRRREGDGRTTRSLAVEFLGTEAKDSEIDQVTRSLPWAARVWGSHRARWIVAASTVVVAATGIVLFAHAGRPENSAPTLQSVMVDQPSGRALVYDLDAHPDRSSNDLLAPGAPLDSAQFTAPPNGVLSTLHVGPRGLVAAQVAYRDSGGVDIAVGRGSGVLRRLTYSPEDDNFGDWSPDGRWIVGSSGARSGRGATNYDLMVLDAESGARRWLTSGPAHDKDPKLSPDGARIAFLRMSLDTLGYLSLCTIPFGGGDVSCHIPRDIEIRGVIGWIDRGSLLLDATTAAGGKLVRWSVDDGQATTIRSTFGLGSQLSPDGRWVLCRCAGGQEGELQLFRLDDPSRLIELRVPAGGSLESLGWDPRQAEREWPDRVTIQERSPHGQVGIPIRLGASVTGDRGSEMGSPGLYWSSSHPEVADVEGPTGIVRPHRTGTSWIRATIGGWRTDSVLLTVTSAGTTLTRAEDWGDGWDARWSAFGDPRPFVSRDASGRLLHVNGDGSNASGVFRTIDGMSGSFGVEMDVRTPIHRVNWQWLELGVDLGVDPARLRSWDRLTGALPTSVDGRCRIGVGGESLFWRGRVSTGAGQETAAPADPDSVSNGTAWHRLRLQLFDDGRCGAAIDGHAVWQSSVTLTRHYPAVLQISGGSYQTDIVVRGVETWSGVRADVDWSRAPTAEELAKGQHR